MARDRAFVARYLETRACVDCGESDRAVLDFDHVGPKTRAISEMVATGLTVEAIAAELVECEVVCANCHRRRTAARAKWRRLDQEPATFRNWKQRRNVLFVYGYLRRSACVDCGLAEPLVLEFDHIGAKRATVTRLAWDGYSIPTIMHEISQCEVRCCNCHRRRTAERRTEAPEPV